MNYLSSSPSTLICHINPVYCGNSFFSLQMQSFIPSSFYSSPLICTACYIVPSSPNQIPIIAALYPSCSRHQHSCLVSIQYSLWTCLRVKSFSRPPHIASHRMLPTIIILSHNSHVIRWQCFCSMAWRFNASFTYIIIVIKDMPIHIVTENVT